MTDFATPRQISYITDLAADRGITPNLDGLTKRAASQVIDALKALPRRPKATALTTSERRPADDGTGVTVYALHADEFDPIVVNGWVPTHSGPVPGHSCPDGCCGLQIDFSTYDELHAEVGGYVC